MRKEKMIYLMCGLAFAGKSTLAERIAERTGAQIISLDKINAERNLYGGKGIPDHEWLATHQIALQRLDSIAREGRTVIIDDTNCFRWLRDNYRKKAEAYGYQCVVVLLDVPPETVLQRASQNTTVGTRSDVSPEIMQDLIYKFEYPAADEENVLKYSPSDSVPDWLARNFPEF
jgi:predicted kinase